MPRIYFYFILFLSPPEKVMRLILTDCPTLLLDLGKTFHQPDLLIYYVLTLITVLPYYRQPVGSVGRAPDYRAGGRGPGRTNTQGLKITEKLLPLFLYLQMIRTSRLLG